MRFGDNMTKSLYEDALADAKRLRELAEETAKNRLVETIMPQIRQMVDRKILGEDISVEDLEAQEDDLPEIQDSMEDAELEVIDLAPPAPAAPAAPAASAGPSLNFDVNGDINIEIETETESDEEDLVLNGQMAEALMKLISGENNLQENRLTRLENSFQKLSNIVESVRGQSLTSSQQKRINKSFVLCVKEARNLQKQLILSEQATQGDLEHRLTKIIKEMRNMSKSNNRNIFDFLFEAEDVEEAGGGLDEAELSIALSDEEREELAGAEDADAVDAALDGILDDLEVSMDAEPGGDDEAEEPEAEEAEEEGEEEGDEVELPEADMDEIYEIDESALRRELNRLHEEAEDEVDQFGGGDAPHGDVFVDVDEEDLINALADELGSVSDAPAVAAESRRRRNSRALTEARRTIKKNEATITELKKQLVEMNLFNAKLLYANKLMQNKGLTMKQQRSIVEALDNAKTIREAKLLFKGLSKSLVRKAAKPMNEGALRAGSSSKTIKSGQAQNASPEAARWAVLAGLKG